MPLGRRISSGTTCHACSYCCSAAQLGYGFPGDADDFEAELAREINHADPADLSGIVRLAEEFRGRVITRQDPAFSTSVAPSQRFRQPEGPAGDRRPGPDHCRDHLGVYDTPPPEPGLIRVALVSPVHFAGGGTGF
ncbi:hypothetical protein GCM10010330_45310 [Streptomyces tendae]|uniref:hypothetical protein n=1 Tax=Streptomyces tendae TaxID=1932 RepID=UPI001679FCAF|nr:hypothetical protein [Streptomyces tendae]GHA85929.1 hypothetical protein GCM10010330_45310 [Streptomyces tendae]